jgi:flagellar biosynthesis protein FlhF
MPAGSRPTSVKTFTAPSLPLALEQVRRELGPEALILETREILPQKWQFWRRQARQVCVTAGLDAQAPTRFLWRTPLPGITATYEVEHGSAPALEMKPGATPSVGGPASSTVRLVGGRVTSRLGLGHPPAVVPDARPGAPASTPAHAPFHLSLPAAPAGAGVDRQAQLEQQVAELQSRLAALSAVRSTTAPAITDPDLRSRLQALDMEEELIASLEQAVQLQFPTPIGFERALPCLRAAIQNGLSCAAPIGVHRGERTVVALVGPSGAGKTTTLAKLAANLQAAGRRVAVLSLASIEGPRGPSATELAGLTNIPHHTVQTPGELDRALRVCATAEVVLLDTAGRNPRHPPHWRALRDQLDAAQPHEIHLVLSPSWPTRSMRALAQPFLDLGANRLLLTKLDELPGLGLIPSLAREMALPISYLSMGSQIPDDLEHANARRLARLVLREEPLSDPFRAPE